MNRFAAAIALTAISTGICASHVSAQSQGHTAGVTSQSAPYWAEDAQDTPCAYALGVGGERVAGWEDGSAVDTCWGAVYRFDPESNEWTWWPEAGPRVQVAAALSNLGLREYLP